MNENQIIGAGTGLRLVMERVELVAPLDIPILILGETGTGKEVISRAIHNRSKRSRQPFVRVNCGAIPHDLIDSHLFGHERGSFTGAHEERRGWFERADGGTLFLDEVGELPLAAQVRLLRVLQDHQFERVGGQAPVTVDVRIIAATHCDLAEMVKRRSFRDDLWFRINVFPILLPSLRERVDDIPALASHFARRAAERFGLSAVEPTKRDQKLLCEYSWPGNIRELHAVIDRAAILGNGVQLEIRKALGVGGDSLRGGAETFASRRRPTNSKSDPNSSPILSLDEAISEHIRRALTLSRGQIEGGRGAAALLRTNPHTLRAKMRKLRIDWGAYRDG